jgi:hypothetical protein
MCLDEFTDEVARRREWRTFAIGKMNLLQRFLIDIETLVMEGRIAAEVDDVLSVIRCVLPPDFQQTIVSGMRRWSLQRQ